LRTIRRLGSAPANGVVLRAQRTRGTGGTDGTGGAGAEGIVGTAVVGAVADGVVGTPVALVIVLLMACPG
jgi:hypothetical protein